MTVERLQLLRNVGQFDSVDAGARITFTKLTLIYAENGRGKTTLSAILRSAGVNDPQLVIERRRLGAAHHPHVVLGFGGGPIVFQNGTWSATPSGVAVFDDAFVAANVCSGMEIETAHRQNVHELILGAQGVALSNALQAHVARIEEHNRNLRQKVQAGNPATERQVAAALRPILEAFIRVAYPGSFSPGSLLGPFIGLCQQQVGGANQILSQADIIELRALLDYANRFHHDKNLAWETAAINDQELTDFCRRTLAFARRA